MDQIDFRPKIPIQPRLEFREGMLFDIRKGKHLKNALRKEFWQEFKTLFYAREQ
jgi:hypothetical protein